MKPQSLVHRWVLGVVFTALPLVACVQSTSYTGADTGGTYVVVKPENIPADGNTPALVTVVVRRQNGAPLSGLQVGLHVDNGAINQPQAATDANGETSATLTAAVPGEHTVSAKLLLSGGSVALSAATLINAYAPASPGTALVPKGTYLNLIVQSFPGNLQTGYRGTVHFTSTDTAATLPLDYTFTAADAGIHLFSDLMLSTGGNQTVTVTDTATGHVLRTASFNVADTSVQSAAPPTQLTMSAPAQTSAGLANRVLVLARDAQGNIADAFTGTVHWSSTDPNAHLPSDTVFSTTDRGQHTFPDVTLLSAGEQNITVSAVGLASATQQVMVTPGLPRYLGFVTFPTSAVACSPFTPALQVQEYDQYGNATSNFGDTVALTLQGQQTAAVLQGNTQVRTINGVATFTNLAVSTAGSGYVLSASIGYEPVSGPMFSVGPDTPRVISVGPVAAGSGDIAVPYVISDACGTPVDLTVSFDPNQSGTFVRASAAPSNANYQGVHSVPTTLAGVPGTFLWNSLGDVGHQSLPGARLRISASAQGAAGAATISAPFAVANGPTFGAPGTVAASAAQSCVALADLNHDARLDMLACSTSGNTVTLYRGNGTGAMTPAQVLSLAGPTALDTGLLDGDAAIDLVVAQNNNTVTVALGQGGGNVTVGASVALPAAPLGIEIADINNDGKRDFVAALANGSVAASAGGGDGTFGAVTITPLGTRLSALVAADLNRDGDLDVVAADSGANALLVAHGSGTSGFATPTVYPVTGTEAPVALAVTDLNHDGAQDVVAALSGGNIGVWLGNHSGGLVGPVRYIAGPGPAGIAIADYDGDGVVDAAVACTNSNVVVLRGDGAGHLGAPVAFPSGAGPVALAVGDINGDNEPDIATANGAGLSLSLLTNAQRQPHNAHWSMPVITKFKVVGNFPTGSLDLGDLNGDGKTDIALTLPQQPGMGIMLGDGAGNLSTGYIINIETPDPQGLELTDLNRDGIMDLITASDASNGLIISFGPVTFGSSTARFASTQLLGVEGNPANVTTADLNADGWPDIVVPNASEHDFSVIVNINGTSFAPEVAFQCGTSPNWLEVADVNGDAFPDVVVAESGQNTVAIYANDGAANFSLLNRLNTSNNPHQLVVGDVDGDGHADLVVAAAANNVHVFAGTGDGNFVAQPTVNCPGTPTAVALRKTGTALPQLAVLVTASPWQLRLYPNLGHFVFGTPVGTVTDYSPSGISLGDLNGDGDDDMVTSSGSNTVTSVLTDGRGGLQLTSPTGSTADYYNGGVNGRSTTADFDWDGNLDIAEMNLAAVGLKRGTAVGTFSPFSQLFAVASSTASRSIQAADVNHDGWPDVVATMNAGAYVSLNDGAGHLGSANTYGPAGLTTATLLDYNLDGNVDLIAGTGNSLQLLLNNGVGQFSTSTTWNTGSNVSELTPGDFDQDGQLDLVISVNNNLQLYLRQGADYISHGPALTGPCNLGNAGVADLNRDGSLDVVGHCISGGGQIFVYLGGGDGSFSAAAPYDCPGAPDSHLVVADVTLDGVPDVLNPLASGKGIGLWVGNGDGTLQAVRYPGADVFPSDISIGDFNYDGLVDMFILGQDYSVAFGRP